MSIVWDQKQRCGDWALARMKDVESWGDWYQAIGWEKDGELQAVVVYNYCSKADISMHVAAVPGRRWMTREFLKAVFAYPFKQLGVRRVTGFVPAKNTDAQRFDEHLGFEREGYMKHAMPDDDVIVYGMLRERCRFI